MQAKARGENALKRAVARMANLLAESHQAAIQYLESERDLFAWLISSEDLARFEQQVSTRRESCWTDPGRGLLSQVAMAS